MAMVSSRTSQELAKGIELYLAKRRDTKEENYLKSKPQTKKGIVTQGINARLVNIAKRLCGNSDAVKTVEKAKKTKEQTALVFQQQKYQALLALIGEEVVDSELHDLKSEYVGFVAVIKEQYAPSVWLDGMTDKAKDISFATHVAKLTHSSSKGSSVLDASKCRNNRYLTTNSLIDPSIDTASSNAASLPVADILKVSSDGYSVLDCLKVGSYELFEAFTTDQAQIQRWVSGLKQAYDSDKKQSYFLSKQVYFPIATNQYHLLLPLTSSSLAQVMHLEFRKFFDDEEQVKAREQRKKGKYSSTVLISYPNKAKLNITGSNHSNASALNGARGGKIILLSAQPPQWTTHNVSFREADKLFNKRLAYQLMPEIQGLRKYFKLLKSKSLSDSKPERRNAIVNKLNDIISELFDFILTVNNNKKPGWTLQSKLPIEYQLLFEAWRDDDISKAVKVTKDWQKELCEDFSFWLSKQLNEKGKLELNPRQIEGLKKVFSLRLRSFVAAQEVAL
ncbi:type I-F CRISPR-associated protein Csy1 [Oceanimonas smirnovii]|uniref:type I-F CRISPR-associated protein Csy1 n=1 Tax=Oceanimonas smirnovii TaxID=264574 RepID=UPI00376FF135